MAIQQQTTSTVHATVQSIDKADMAHRRIQETMDLGEYERFVMEKHTARETWEWLEKWTEYWKQIGFNGSVVRSKFQIVTPLSLLQLMFSAESRL